MDDDWDLHAVVRACATAVTGSTVSTRTTTAAAAAAGAAATNNHPFPCFPSNLPYHDDPNSFDFPGLVDDRNDPFQGLQEIYQEFCVVNPPPTAAAAADISATSLMPVPPPLVLQPHHHSMQVSPPLPLNMQIQENVQFTISPTLGSPPQDLPASIPQPTRPRRRKNQQIKIVRQMTQEELSADSWAWRKYGQKPIKGSPYPRNYYRCSTSKGCAARKQVERSSNDPEAFVVTYAGEHTHPRPTHRSSLAGSTRSKFASSQPKRGGGSINAILSQKGTMTSSSSSPATGSSFSPATPSIEGEAAAQNDDVHMAEEVDGDDDENEIMILNDFMNDDDDLFRAFQDSDDHSSGGGGDFFSSGLLSSPPWTPTSSAGNAGTFNGGGGSN